MKNICFFAHAANLTGANKSMLELIVQLNKSERYKCSVILPCNGPLAKELLKNNIEFKVIRSFSWIVSLSGKDRIKSILRNKLNFIAIYKIKKYLKDKNIDLIHVNTLLSGIGAIVANEMKIKYIWHIREFMEEDHGIEFLNKKLAFKLLGNASGLIAISDDIKEKYERLLNKEVIQIYNGIDYDTYNMPEKKNLYKDSVEIMIIGRICEGKGQIEAVKAMELLLKDEELKNYRINLSIIGNKIDDYFDNLEEYIKNNNLASNMKILPFSNNINEYRKNCDIQLVCSKNEAFGRVTIEGMIAKCLVIGAKSGFTKKLIIDGYNGILYESENYKDLYLKIKKAILNKDLTEQIIRNSYEYVKENFLIQSTAKNVIKYYEELIGG